MHSATLVGLTGGIGAGKSTVARMLATHGARIVDGDAAARDVVDPASPRGSTLLTRITALLGDGVLTPAGTLDRTAVAARVFADADLLREYNALLRPALLDEVGARIAEARRAPGVVVHEIPLLSRTTAALPWRYDVIVTVEADPRSRRHRLMHDRGYDAREAERRIRAQGDEADRIAIADVVLRTDGAVDDTLRAATALWRRLSAGRPTR